MAARYVNTLNQPSGAFRIMDGQETWADLIVDEPIIGERTAYAFTYQAVAAYGNLLTTKKNLRTGLGTIEHIP